MRKTVFLILCIIIPCIAKAQSGQSLPEQISNSFKEQLLLYPQEKIYLNNDRSTYITGERIWFRAFSVYATTHEPAYWSRYVYAELIDEKGSVKKRVKIKPDDNNLHYGYIQTEEDWPTGDYMLRAYTRYLLNSDNDYFPTCRIRLVNPDTGQGGKAQQEAKDYDVMLFPEGGQLLTGIEARVAFKAINNLGLHENIEGALVDNKNNVLASVQSFHDGMGVFSIKPEAGKEYYLQTTNSNGKKKKVKLPESHYGSYALKVERTDNIITVSVLQNAISPPNNPLFLMIHTGGLVQHVSSAVPGEPMSFDERNFPSGLHQIVLIDSGKNILSERLVFFRNAVDTPLNIGMDKDIYTTRDKIKLDCSVDIPGAKKGNFTISVTDGADVEPNLSSNIASNLLLTSELKGYIENPAYYFSDDPDAIRALDLVMMTHGWRRYDVQQILKGNYYKPTEQPESSQVVSGKAMNIRLFGNKPLKDGKVRLFIPEIGFLEDVKPGDDGRFEFTGLELGDSLRYLLKAYNPKGDDWIELTIDSMTFPRVDKKELLFPGLDLSYRPGYTNKALEKYLNDYGMRIIQLREIEVRAKKKQYNWSAFQEIMSSRASKTFDSEYLEKNHITSIYELIYKVPGARIIDGEIYMRTPSSIHKATPAALIIDGVYIHPDEDITAEMNISKSITPPLIGEASGRAIIGASGPRSTARYSGYKEIYKTIYMQDVERVEIIKTSDAAALLGPRGSSGAIAITTKMGVGNFTPPPKPNAKTITPLGCQTPIEFYSPKYETTEEKNSSVPDLRTTIYWNPAVMLPESGKATVEFYSADNVSTYYIIAEGLLDDGTILHSVQTVEVINLP